MAVAVPHLHVPAMVGHNAAALRIAVAGRAAGDGVDGIRDHTLCLRDALAARGACVRLVDRRPDTTWSTDDGSRSAHLAAVAHGSDALLLQYNPFLYGRFGFAPWLAAELASLRRGGMRVAVMVHETAMPLRGVRSTAMGLWQRAQLRAVVRSADVALVSIEAWTRMLSRRRSHCVVRHLPVGSNLPDARSVRAVSRWRLGLGDDDVAVATLSTGHPSHLAAPVRDTLNRLAAAGHRVTLLRLGAGAVMVHGLRDDVRVHQPGRQPASLLAAGMAAADMALMPYVDGVSTRRGGLMAALQNGVAVVGSDGPLTDDVLRAGGPVLTPLESMPDEALRLAAHPTVRTRVAAEGRRLYEERFDWPVIAAEVLAALGGAGR